MIKISVMLLTAVFLISFDSIQNPASAQAVYELKFNSPQLLQKGQQLLKEGDTVGAQRVYKKVLKSNLTTFQTARAHNGLCVAFIIEEVWQTALEHCDKAIRIYPQNWRFYNNRGNIFLETGMLKQAISEYEKGLKFSPRSNIIKNNLDIAQARLSAQLNSDNLEKQKSTTNI
ncbi:tetratricopeptide repeat protein [Kordiimonas sp. SCSIO 12610]|uniref:tetratricopeptide repeat protein n=1 Tax=Kordiimonas sp. SCSIO 12610 TaxID=2829597 RepID=UPI00210A6086|nr:tetratricopeptide repeat protein [Kordiimonas sp. SCSIO 12610]UTW55294.1 tetratricopeptide repeat protein [Kordiimonas sp. SCSIO 12610]